MVERRDDDERWMAEAIELAWGGLGRVEPNPMVGCVIVRDGQLIGRGFHETFGQAHAEVNALADCKTRGESACGATAYVTLEPCCHHGKTPPCADALIRAEVSRVVVAAVDPFDQVDGGGVCRLRDAGIRVDTGVGLSAATQQLAAYLKRVRTGRPWVIAKWAMSMDGRIATTSGESQWITGESARRGVHELRGRVDGIAIGMGTMIADDPMLTARGGGARTPARIVFARSRVPSLNSRLVESASQTPAWLVAGPQVPDSEIDRLADHGVKVIRVQSSDSVSMIDEALVRFGSSDNPSGQPMTHLMIEGGGELLGSFAAGDQIDECHVYVGAKVIGGRAAPGPVGDPGIAKLSDATGFSLEMVDRFDDDVRMIYRRTLSAE
ncbi:bifunctional diaminohydroxyphosphoribosylaminopyrimidine deaminase/5-amino-6-(5-phosphoribosylamino)uracil reductase RibD [Aporhodopirellula aestuarii]|uniref:Riboflavin biosynthesis protein RibD n=1 Tax=Aporhodopirellula aestuarii TaxID=2950107 RepID=A0ABT0UDI8_9BACT|nr:bifunctional diaminohydroxyphosphoribosylaminopyrimidine deaminase/5-amino-6-(5-phosphoribosylamino)uracil reductase RibD [Aporhodopirellula aestuarii]MCM2374799.1 bifunctional diaminohydroxyphosphoribosylaminopyrimidine deaminase/5-amino-6-(5-phosphoribosylamino)uracil reductase RibD [Aporhodopirellula aestuarii]